MWSCFRLSSRHAPRYIFLTITPVVLFLSSKSPTQSESTCTWKSSCINSMGSSFLARHNRTDSRHQCPCCQRSATMFGVFLHCVLCYLITWATHSHPFRAQVYCGCQPGATGVLINPGRAVDQQCANPLSGCCSAAALH